MPELPPVPQAGPPPGEPGRDAALAPPKRVLSWTDRSSLVPLVRVTAANAAGDAFVAVALADSLFFGVPLGQARGRVALYLLLTMVPFAVLAPVLGPFLDRSRSGRRSALALSLLLRAVLAWTMAAAGEGIVLYPLAFSVLVLSKGFHLARAAALPRLLPEETTLVAGNARLSATSLVVSSVAGLSALAITKLAGFAWSLRTAGVLFGVGVALALVLPSKVNSARTTTGTSAPEPLVPPRFTAAVRAPLVATAAVRAAVGFLTTYLAFLLRQEGGGALGVGLLVAGAAIGSLAGTILGNNVRDTPPSTITLAAAAGVSAAATVAATVFNAASAIGVAAVTALAAALAKLALDAVLQREVPDEVRGQAFARSETLLQLAWVAGGFLGVALPLRGALGLGLVAAGTAAGALAAVRISRAHPIT